MIVNADVEKFMKKLDHPFKAELEALRTIILGAGPEVTEVIKWSCPTFVYKGNIASLVVRTRKQAQLMFHQGALIDDKTGMLVGTGKAVRMANFSSMAEVKRGKRTLTRLVREWIEIQDAKE